MEQIHGKAVQQALFEQKLEILNAQLGWFPKNERLQRKVKTQFKIIKRKTAMLEGKLTPSNAVKEWMPTGGIHFVLNDGLSSITEFPWYHNYGFTWWLSMIGADHLQFCLNRCKAQFFASRTRLEECEVTMSIARKDIIEIETQAEADETFHSFEIEECNTKGQRLADLGKVAERLYEDLRTKITKKDKIVDEHKQLIAKKDDLLIVIEEE